MEQAIEFAVGVVCVVIGLSCLLHRADWQAWLDGLRLKGRSESLTVGMVGLGVSALIVGFHPVWSGIPLIVTLIGVAGIIEGAVYLLFPAALPRALSLFAPHPRLFTVWSVAVILLGAVILHGWWMGR